MAEKPWLTVEELAERLQLHPQSVWRQARTDPSFPQPIRLTGGTTRWSRVQVEAWEAGKLAEAGRAA